MKRYDLAPLVAALLVACGSPLPQPGESDGGSFMDGGGGGDGGSGFSCTEGQTVCDLLGNCRSPRYAIELVSGDGQQAEWFHSLAKPIVARVVNCDGIPQAGVPVLFEAPKGWLLDRTSATTDSRGEVQVRARAGWRYAESGLAINGPDESRRMARVNIKAPPQKFAYSALGEERVPGQAGIPGLSVSGQVDEPRGMAWDFSDPTLYVAGDCRVIAVDRYGFSRVVAGTGVCGFSGDGGDARTAQLDRPVGLALDVGDWLYIADSGNGRIRAVNLQTGVIDTVAGGGSAAGPGFGDGSDPKLASLSQPGWIAFSPHPRELYVADTGHDRVRAISLGDTRSIRTVLAPGGSCETDAAAFQGCGGQLGCSMAWVEKDQTTAAPSLLVSGSVCGKRVGGSGPGIIRLDDYTFRVDYAAGAVPGTNASVVEARAVGFTSPPLLAADDKWLAVADPDGHRVYTVDAHAAVFTAALGDGVAETTGDGALAQSARVNRPTGLLMASGELWVSESGGNTVRGLIAPTTGVPTPVSIGSRSGSGERQWPMEPTEQPFSIRLTRPGAGGTSVGVPGVTVDWEPDATSPCHLGGGSELGPRQVLTDAEGVSTVAARHGMSSCRAFARFRNLHGELFLSPAEMRKEVELEPYGSIFTVVNDARVTGASGVPGLGVLARLPPPVAMANDQYHRMSFVVGCAVVSFDNNGFLSVLAGSVTECGFSGDGGPASAARLSNPQGITFAVTNNEDFLYIADTGNNRVRRVD
ncbi:MAG: hypothetical protein L0Y66_26200, partial [Myxococcaceae bacterium]|nr:hypothetical protein [Myxococcaceae bacterium]